MKKNTVQIMLLIFLVSTACSTGEILSPATPTPTLVPTPAPLLITAPSGDFSLVVPGSTIVTDYSTQYDTGGVMLTDENEGFTMVCVNVVDQGFSPNTMSIMILMIYEGDESGLKVDKNGLAYATTSVFDLTLNGRAGKGFGFSGKVDGQPVEGELIALESDSGLIFVSLAYINASLPDAWKDTGKEIFESILETVKFPS